jgi:hypothetical protein
VNDADRVCEKFVEVGVVPSDVRILHRSGEIEPLNRAALAPTMPANDGSTLFSPGAMAWQTAQWAAKTFSPVAGSPAAKVVDELPSMVISTRPAWRKAGLIS